MKVNEGVVFETGDIVPGTKFNQVDLYATAGGDSLTLKTGGETSVVNSPVTWFKTGKNVETFALLADVPSTKPTADQNEALTQAKQGNGFVAEGFISAGWTRGFISKADAASVTIEYMMIAE